MWINSCANTCNQTCNNPYIHNFNYTWTQMCTHVREYLHIPDREHTCPKTCTHLNKYVCAHLGEYVPPQGRVKTCATMCVRVWLHVGIYVFGHVLYLGKCASTWTSTSANTSERTHSCRVLDRLCANTSYEFERCHVSAYTWKGVWVNTWTHSFNHTCTCERVRKCFRATDPTWIAVLDTAINIFASTVMSARNASKL
jgi:hypothetical protein